MSIQLSDNAVAIDKVPGTITVGIVQGWHGVVPLGFRNKISRAMYNIAPWRFEIAQTMSFLGTVSESLQVTGLLANPASFGALRVDLGSSVGVLNLHIPENFYTDPIQPNSTRNTPVAVAMLEVTVPDVETFVIRLQVVIKYGVEGVQ